VVGVTGLSRWGFDPDDPDDGDDRGRSDGPEPSCHRCGEELEESSGPVGTLWICVNDDCGVDR
jgi:hypothetical protein